MNEPCSLVDSGTTFDHTLFVSYLLSTPATGQIGGKCVLGKDIKGSVLASQAAHVSNHVGDKSLIFPLRTFPFKGRTVPNSVCNPFHHPCLRTNTFLDV